MLSRTSSKRCDIPSSVYCVPIGETANAREEDVMTIQALRNGFAPAL